GVGPGCGGGIKEDISNAAHDTGKTGQVTDHLAGGGLVEAGVLVPIRILVGCQITVMRQMVPVVDSGDRADGPQQEQIAEKIVAPGSVKEAAVQAVVTDDEEGVITITDSDAG